MRCASAFAITLLLAACSSGGEQGGQMAEAKDAKAAKAAGSTVVSVPCALAGARDYTAECQVERQTVNGRTIVTVRHPNGGFRRLVELDSGKRFAAADGSDEVALEKNGAEIEVTLGDDHYLFPAPANAQAR